MYGHAPLNFTCNDQFSLLQLSECNTGRTFHLYHSMYCIKTWIGQQLCSILRIYKSTNCCNVLLIQLGCPLYALTKQPASRSRVGLLQPDTIHFSQQLSELAIKYCVRKKWNPVASYQIKVVPSTVPDHGHNGVCAVLRSGSCTYKVLDPT